MPQTSLRALREAARLTQAELAARAGVSRQLVGAVENGRHLPRIDAALALARALGVDVEALFESDARPVDAVSGSPPAEGAAVRIGWVGSRAVTAPTRIGAEGWDVADGVVEGGMLDDLSRHRSSFVVAGCEPGLEVLERLLREQGTGAVAAVASSAAALDALVSGRVHAAVVHWPERDEAATPEGIDVDRFRLARWQVGLAGPPDARSGWWRPALAGRAPVVQREEGAQAQRTFERALLEHALPARASDRVPGPRVSSHLEAARRAVLTGLAAVTIEPTARGVGASFHPLGAHEAQLWVARDWLGDRSVTDALTVISSPRFQRSLSSVGGYDLAHCGDRAA